GFLFFGNTSISTISVDHGRFVSRLSTTEPHVPPLLLPPGPHAILFRAFRDPVAVYACMLVTLEKGHTYIVRTTKPEMENTTMWMEDAATGQVLGQKYPAEASREPQGA